MRKTVQEKKVATKCSRKTFKEEEEAFDMLIVT